jgi:hypothetical protein
LAYGLLPESELGPNKYEENRQCEFIRLTGER